MAAVQNLSVTFQIDQKTGDLTCIPTVLHTSPGDVITFETKESHPFTVVSRGISPLEAAEIRSDGKPTSIKVSHVPMGVYPLACAVCDLGKREIYIDAGCPSIIIGPGRT
jgi:plastocyanin